MSTWVAGKAGVQTNCAIFPYLAKNPISHSTCHLNVQCLIACLPPVQYHYNQLRQAFAQMAPPSSLEDCHDTVAAPSYTAGGQTSAQCRQSATADFNVQPVCTGAAPPSTLSEVSTSTLSEVSPSTLSSVSPSTLSSVSPSTLSEVSPSSQSSVSTSSVGVSTNPSLSDVRFSSHDQ